MGLGVVIAWGVPELIVRILQPVLEQYRGIYFAGDPNSPLLFQTDPRLHWKLRPDTRVTFLETPVVINRDGMRGPETAGPGDCVLCLGDSTPFGWRLMEEECFPGRLRDLLLGQSPGAWKVLNAGVPGYSSFQVRIQAERLLPLWHPKVTVLCVGNNDVWPAEHSDQALDEASHQGAFETISAHSRFLVWLREKLRPQTPQAFVPESLEGAGPRVNRREFEQNLRVMVRLAQQQGGRVILMGPGSNIYLPPFLTRALAGNEKSQKWSHEIITRLQAGESTGVQSEIERALKADPDDLSALWFKGRALISEKKEAEGRVFLEAVVERQPFPESCPPSFQAIIRRVAAEEKTEYVDINEILREAVPGQLPTSLYVDGCHPTAEGHRLIAEKLMSLIEAHSDRD